MRWSAYWISDPGKPAATESAQRWVGGEAWPAVPGLVRRGGAGRPRRGRRDVQPPSSGEPARPCVPCRRSAVAQGSSRRCRRMLRVAALRVAKPGLGARPWAAAPACGQPGADAESVVIAVPLWLPATSPRPALCARIAIRRTPRFGRARVVQSVPVCAPAPLRQDDSSDRTARCRVDTNPRALSDCTPAAAPGAPAGLPEPANRALRERDRADRSRVPETVSSRVALRS